VSIEISLKRYDLLVGPARGATIKKQPRDSQIEYNLSEMKVDIFGSIG
jgi:hypothetical protein